MLKLLFLIIFGEKYILFIMYCTSRGFIQNRCFYGRKETTELGIRTAEQFRKF